MHGCIRSSHAPSLAVPTMHAYIMHAQHRQHHYHSIVSIAVGWLHRPCQQSQCISSAMEQWHALEQLLWLTSGDLAGAGLRAWQTPSCSAWLAAWTAYQNSPTCMPWCCKGTLFREGLSMGHVCPTRCWKTTGWVRICSSQLLILEDSAKPCCLLHF